MPMLALSADLPFGDPVGPGEDLEKLSGHQRDFIGLVDLSQGDDELVSTEAGHGVAGPHAGGEPFGHASQQFVPLSVAETVVDHLEPVEIHQQDRQEPFFPPGEGDPLVQAVGEEVAVGQAGQAVVVGLVLQLLFVTFPVGDVLIQDKTARKFPIFIPKGNRRMENGLAGSVEALDVDPFVVRGLAPADGPDHAPLLRFDGVSCFGPPALEDAVILHSDQALPAPESPFRRDCPRGWSLHGRQSRRPPASPPPPSSEAAPSA